MAPAPRAGHMDVSNTVDVTDPRAVASAVRAILQRRYRDVDFSIVDLLVQDFNRLYSGDYPGFRACDIKYHDSQHVLDVTLAMARLLDGYEGSSPGRSLGPERALAGIATALFHDSGYIRRVRDTRNSNGAAYTRVHVGRSARFLGEYLPGVGLGNMLGICTRIVFYTGYDLDLIPPACHADPCEHRLGTLLGTADLIAQMADVDYVRKCRDHLYEEFVAGGIAGEEEDYASDRTVYRSADHLLESTPEFIRGVISDRLEDRFDGVYRYAGDFFGGPNLYMDSILHNCERLEAMLSGEQLGSVGMS